MKKKIGYLFILTFFVSTTHTIFWSDWSPSSLWATRNLSSDRKAIRSIIKNCSNASLDTTFNLEAFLEKEDPRTVYEWLQLLATQYEIKFPTKNDSSTATTLRDTLVAKLRYASPALQISATATLPPSCAKKAMSEILKQFPSFAENPSINAPLTLDQAHLLYQKLTALPLQGLRLTQDEQTSLQKTLETTSVALLYPLLKLWGINKKEMTDSIKDQKAVLLNTIANLSWQQSPAQLHIQNLQNQLSAAENKNCFLVGSGYDHDCGYEKDQEVKACRTNLTNAKSNAPSFDSLKDDLLKSMPTSLAIDSRLTDAAQVYIKLSYPQV